MILNNGPLTRILIFTLVISLQSVFSDEFEDNFRNYFNAEDEYKEPGWNNESPQTDDTNENYYNFASNEEVLEKSPKEDSLEFEDPEAQREIQFEERHFENRKIEDSESQRAVIFEEKHFENKNTDDLLNADGVEILDDGYDDDEDDDNEEKESNGLLRLEQKDLQNIQYDVGSKPEEVEQGVETSNIPGPMATTTDRAILNGSWTPFLIENGRWWEYQHFGDLYPYLDYFKTIFHWKRYNTSTIHAQFSILTCDVINSNSTIGKWRWADETKMEPFEAVYEDCHEFKEENNTLWPYPSTDSLPTEEGEQLEWLRYWGRGHLLCIRIN